MTTLLYSIRIFIQNTSTLVFDGYFKVNGNNSVIAFYDNANPTTNILGPSTFPAPLDFYVADNVFNPITNLFVTPEIPEDRGTNFTSISLQNALNETYPYFNLFVDFDPSTNILTNYLWQESSITNTIFIEPYVLPLSNICFPSKTPILTDQGPVPIDSIDIKKNTINNKKIIAITQTILNDTSLICFRKNSIAPNYPIQKTIITKDHEIYYKGKFFRASEFMNKQFDGIYPIKYNGEILYNVLLETHDKMIVNGLICETLNPKNVIAKLYQNNEYIFSSYETKKKIIEYINKTNIQARISKKKSIFNL